MGLNASIKSPAVISGSTTTGEQAKVTRMVVPGIKGADGDITVTHSADAGLATNGTFTGTSLIASTSFLPDANAGADIITIHPEATDDLNSSILKVKKLLPLLELVFQISFIIF